MSTETLEAQLATIAQESAFLKKYFSLRNKCEQMHQANEKLVNRIQHVKKLIKRTKRERRYLVSRLEEHGDNFREAQVPVMWEEDQLYNLLRSPPPYPGSGSEAESASKARPSALSSIQPLLQAHGMSSEAPTNKKGKKIKQEKEKDPLAPKKPVNAFMLFRQQRRAGIQEEYFKEHRDAISAHELTRRLALEWENMAAEQKKVYQDMYEQSMQQYEIELQEYSMGQYGETTDPRRPTSPLSDAAMTALELASRYGATLNVKQEVDD
ncbi:non-histone protein 10-like [Haliotis rubra]|uniref:non-histone protein 10-like n=1 Tax=Haliotis rubra TaxID=36100 RepID=UPI001EE4FF43|nr:non-histone protein 10-like [Haliotis rubra]